MVEILWKAIGIVEKCSKSVAANTQRKALKILVVSIVSIVERKIYIICEGHSQTKTHRASQRSTFANDNKLK